MPKLESKREASQLCFLLTVVYMVSYITRTNFSVIVSEMVTSTGFAKSQLALPLIGSFITYGVGQLLSGVLGDKISPKRLVSIGFLGTVVVNVLIPFCPNHWWMLFVWSMNGFAQAMMWPPIVRIITSSYTGDACKKTMTTVSSGGHVGTVIIYLSAPLVILLTGWKGVFIGSAIIGAVMLIVWQFATKDVMVQSQEQKVKAPKTPVKLLLSPLMLLVFLAIILQGMLREGVSAWMPTFISDSFHLGNEISILTGVLLPVFSILCLRFANWLYRKIITHPILCAGALFGIVAFAAFMLYLFCQSNIVVSILSIATVFGSISGVNLMLIGMIPPFFAKRGAVSTISGILNFFTYVGSAVSTYGIAALSEGIGWSNTFLIWIFVALAGGMICLLCIKPWNRTFGNDEE